MRRHVYKALSTPVIPTRTPIRLLLLLRPPPIHLNRFHTSLPLLKRRISDSKAKRRDERQARREQLEEDVEEAEEWLESHNPNHTDSIQGRRAMLLEEVDPFDMDDYRGKLKEAIERFKKEGQTIRQGRSDPEMISSLKVELPEEYGGKLPFLECATVGPKPGDARSLLITVFDPAYTKHIRRAIAESHPTLNPQPAPKNDLQMIIPLPPLTREVRLENQKKAKELGEKQKTVIRNIREKQIKSMRNALKEDPSLGKDALHQGEKGVDKETKSSLEQIDKITEQLKKDIMSA